MGSAPEIDGPIGLWVIHVCRLSLEKNKGPTSFEQGIIITSDLSTIDVMVPSNRLWILNGTFDSSIFSILVGH